jgi:hypothetical protein
MLSLFSVLLIPSTNQISAISTTCLHHLDRLTLPSNINKNELICIKMWVGVAQSVQKLGYGMEDERIAIRYPAEVRYFSFLQSD